MADLDRIIAEYQRDSDVVQIKTVAIDPCPAIDYLRSLEWSLGHDQCPSCYGLRPGVTSFGTLPRGHHPNCKLAHALLCLHQKVEFREE